MIKKIIKLYFGVIALVITSNIVARMPDHVFACHVTTESAIDGIVLIQHDNIEKASAAAVYSKALTIDDKKSKSKSNVVKECIKHPGNNFSDKIIQEFYKNMEM